MGLCLLVVQPQVGKTRHRGVITTAHGFKHPQNHMRNSLTGILRNSVKSVLRFLQQDQPYRIPRDHNSCQAARQKLTTSQATICWILVSHPPPARSFDHYYLGHYLLHISFSSLTRMIFWDSLQQSIIAIIVYFSTLCSVGLPRYG